MGRQVNQIMKISPCFQTNFNEWAVGPSGIIHFFGTLREFGQVVILTEPSRSEQIQLDGREPISLDCSP